jgi:patatin-like phospholipase/acyl hydrolase
MGGSIMAQPRQRILSIDGGGIRGILPLCLLVKLENDTGLRTRQLFSFVAGTSAGAVIAAGIAAGIPAHKILELFIGTANKVFTGAPWNLLTRVVPGHMYSIRRLHDELRTALGAAGNWTMNDVKTQANINLLVTAVGVTDGKPWYFVCDNPRNSKRTGHLALVDCVTASAAAPTYFAPWLMPEDPAARGNHDPIGRLVDGGVSVTGNPIYQACVEAFCYSEGYRPEETLVVSLGTGSYTDAPTPRWIGEWLTWLISEMLRAPNEQQTEIVARQYPQTPCYRINPGLDRDIPLDKAAEAKELKRLGHQFAADVEWEPILNGESSDYQMIVKCGPGPQTRPRPLPASK